MDGACSIDKMRNNYKISHITGKVKHNVDADKWEGIFVIILKEKGCNDVKWTDVALVGWSCGTMSTTGPLHQGVTLEGNISALVFINQQPLARISTNHNQNESCTDKEHINAH